MRMTFSLWIRMRVLTPMVIKLVTTPTRMMMVIKSLMLQTIVL